MRDEKAKGREMDRSREWDNKEGREEWEEEVVRGRERNRKRKRTDVRERERGGIGRSALLPIFATSYIQDIYIYIQEIILINTSF